jgi:hypothetical protein
MTAAIVALKKLKAEIIRYVQSGVISYFDKRLKTIPKM